MATASDKAGSLRGRRDEWEPAVGGITSEIMVRTLLLLLALGAPALAEDASVPPRFLGTWCPVGEGAEWHRCEPTDNVWLNIRGNQIEVPGVICAMSVATPRGRAVTARLHCGSVPVAWVMRSVGRDRIEIVIDPCVLRSTRQIRHLFECLQADRRQDLPALFSHRWQDLTPGIRITRLDPLAR